jgi:predicted nucleic acid-binding protein
VSAVYLESSALLAWLFGEPEASNVQARIDAASVVFSSMLTIAETQRGLLRALSTRTIGPADELRASALLAVARAAWTLVEIDDETWERVGRPFAVEPLRTLDAFHLAVLLRVAPAYPDFIVLSLDQRFRDAAEALGLQVGPLLDGREHGA